MEEKSDLSRQLENLRCELKQQEDKLEYYNQSMNSVGKMTEKLDDLNQSLTLQTREKDLNYS
jgi:division protein CdvB (Snf7/Vps24/ESCRT-III family)